MAEFEWDTGKAESNKSKHGASFEEGKETFNDPNGITLLGNSALEARFVRIGKTASKILLAVVFTVRKAVVRIISVRNPRKKEVETYLENSLSNQDDENN